MSYRAFKHLLGETSLERKCHLLLGAATLLLVSGSFLWYALQTEHVAYHQIDAVGRLLAHHTLLKLHQDRMGAGELKEDQRKLFDDWRRQVESHDQELIPNELRYEGEIITARTADAEKRQIFEEMTAGDEERVGAPVPGPLNYLYREVIRAGDSCIACHSKREPDAAWQRGMPMAVAGIRLSTQTIEDQINSNRAILISTALVTALLLMAGSYFIVRYVIVKPVKHLKDVSDAISAGELNIRSEIQTGDEFESLSHAFNRMLRTLVSMQDQLRKVNSDLDRKVDELAQANVALYQSNKLKSDFLATMSHELRTPLNSILGFSEVLLSNAALEDKQNRWVKNIQSSGERLLSMINDILDLAKMEAGKMQVRVEEFSIADVSEGLASMFRPLAERKNIDLSLQIDPAIPVLRQDANKLQQIIWNLLSNAIKFTPEGGRVVVQAETDGVHLILNVIDTGVGIALGDQELVFEKFRQAGAALTREHSGTGLGLSIIRELAKLLGGNVGLHSELGRGSTFTVTLPLQLSPEQRLDFDLIRESPLPLPVDPAVMGT